MQEKGEEKEDIMHVLEMQENRTEGDEMGGTIKQRLNDIGEVKKNRLMRKGKNTRKF